MIRKFFIFYIILQVQFSYANEFEKGMFALEMEDYERAVYYLSFEAVQGNPRAQYNLGLMYKNGIGVEKDFNEALGWFILGSNNDQTRVSTDIGPLQNQTASCKYSPLGNTRKNYFFPSISNRTNYSS